MNGYKTCLHLIGNLSEEKIEEILNYHKRHQDSLKALDKQGVSKELIDLRDIQNKTEEEVYKTLNKFTKSDKFFVYCGPLLININPGPNKVRDYLNLQSWVKETESKEESEWKPHLYSFMYYVYQTMVNDQKDQLVNMMGQIGSGKTFNIIHILEYYCCMVGMDNYQVETFDYIHKSIQLLHIMGSIFRENNLESTSCGLLLRLGFNSENKICDFDFEAKILDLTLPFSENGRSFSVLHSFITCATSDLKRNFGLPEEAICLNFFKKFTKTFPKKTKERFKLNDYEIWNRFHSLLRFFDFDKEEIIEVLRMFSFILCINELGMNKMEGEGGRQRFVITKGKYYATIIKNLNIDEKYLDESLGTFRDENEVKNTLISLMKYSYYMVFDYIKMKIKRKLQGFFRGIRGEKQEDDLKLTNKSSSKGKNKGSSSSFGKKGSSSSIGKKSKSSSSQKKIEDKSGIKYINFLDFPGEVKDSTLGGIITNLANECINLLAGNSYSLVVEKLIEEKVFLNLFKPLHSFYVVRSLLGDKGLLSFLSNKFTEDNYCDLVNETITKTYYRTCLDFPDKNADGKTKNIFKMVVKYSHLFVNYNYEALYLESKSIVNNVKTYKLFSHCRNIVVKSCYQESVKLNSSLFDFVSNSLGALFGPIEGVAPFVIYLLHSNNSYNLFFGNPQQLEEKKEDEKKNWGIPLQLTQHMLKKSLVIPVLYWEWFGFHEWISLKDFLAEFGDEYLKLRKYNQEKNNFLNEKHVGGLNKKSSNKSTGSKADSGSEADDQVGDEYMDGEDDEKASLILNACYIKKEAVVGKKHVLMKKGTIGKVRERMDKFMAKIAGNKKGQKPTKNTFTSDNPPVARRRSLKVQCHLEFLKFAKSQKAGSSNISSKVQSNSVMDQNQGGDYSKFNIYRIMNKNSDAQLETDEFLDKMEDPNAQLLKDKNRKKNVVVPQQKQFTSIQHLLSGTDYNIYDYSPFEADVLTIQRNYRGHKAYEEHLLRAYIIAQVVKIQKNYKGRIIRKKVKRLKYCLEKIVMIQRNWRQRYYYVNDKAAYIQDYWKRSLVKERYKRKAKRYKQNMLDGEEYCDSSDDEKREQIKKKKKLKEMEEERKNRLEQIRKQKGAYIPPKKKKNPKKKVFQDYALKDDKAKKKKKEGVDLGKIRNKNDLISAILLDDGLMKEYDKKNREIANQKGVPRDMKYELLGFDQNPNKPSSRNGSKGKRRKIEDKLIEYGEVLKQKRAQDQVEKLKKEEMQNTFKPKISKYTPSNNSSRMVTGKDFLTRAKLYEEMKNKRMEQMRNNKPEPDDTELTFKPKIDKKSKAVKRNIDDLYKWNEERKEKRERQAKLKNLQEIEEVEKNMSKVFISDNSRKILDKKEKRRRMSSESGKKNISEIGRKEKEDLYTEPENAIDLWPGENMNIRYVVKEGGDEEEEKVPAPNEIPKPEPKTNPINDDNKIFEEEDEENYDKFE
ncbi:MAG: hypothetical protein MJ252_07765 [archaeon]|nr:hypothetical protein [archaeon]